MNIFDGTHRRFVSYIDKSREFYLNKGFRNPYRWASHENNNNEETPFARLRKPLNEARIGLVTTAALNEEGCIDRQVYAAPTEPAPDYLHTHHLSWHKTATHTRDVDSFFPINRMRELVEQGRVGSLSPRFYGVPRRFSQRRTKREDAPAILDFCRADQVDGALLVGL